MLLLSAPEIDISELESLFSAASASDGKGVKAGGRRGPTMTKPEKVQLVSSVSSSLRLGVVLGSLYFYGARDIYIYFFNNDGFFRLINFYFMVSSIDA